MLVEILKEVQKAIKKELYELITKYSEEFRKLME